MTIGDVFRVLVLVSTAYAIALAGVLMVRILCRTRDAEMVFHVVALSLSWLLACAYFVVDTLGHWNTPTDGRFALALASNIWALLGLHVLECRQRRQTPPPC